MDANAYDQIAKLNAKVDQLSWEVANLRRLLTAREPQPITVVYGWRGEPAVEGWEVQPTEID